MTRIPRLSAGNTQLWPDITPLIGASALASMVIIGILVVRRQDQLTRDSQRTVYALEFPADLTIEQVTAFVRSLTGLRPPRLWLLGRPAPVFEILGRGDGIEHRLRLPHHQTDRVLAQLRALVPGIRATRLDGAGLPAMDVATELALNSSTRPLRTDVAEAFAASLLSGLGSLAPDSREVVVVQMVAFPFGPPSLPTHRPTSLPVGPSWLRSLSKALAGAGPTGKEGLAQLRAKTAEPAFGVVARVGAQSAARGRSWALVGQIVGLLHQLDAPGVTMLTRRLPQRLTRTRLTRAATPITHAPMHVNAQELAVLAGWPVNSPAVPGLTLAGGREFPPVRELVSTGRVLGRATFAGQERPIAISPLDALMHMIISGPTGSGKSTLILNLIKQDIDAGNGLILIDPNGDLARDVIDIITSERLRDLIFLNPADGWVAGLNPLGCNMDTVELVTDQVLSLIRDRAESWGVQLDEAARNALMLLAANGMALTELPAVLVDESFRHRLLATMPPEFRPTTGEFFSRYEGWSDGQRGQIASAVINKVTPMIGRAAIRGMLGQIKPAWAMADVLSHNKILVVALPSGVIGPQAADLIGSMIVSQVWNATMGRIAIGREFRRPSTLYIDEAARFVRGGTDLADMLARARGHGLGLVAAVQHIAQVRPDLRAALMSEARNKIVLQPAADDAALYARHLGVKPEDLLTLPARTAIASLVVGGRVVAPVSVRTFPPPDPTGHGDAARAASRETYGRDRAEVERAIADRRRGGGEAGPRRTRRLP